VKSGWSWPTPTEGGPKLRIPGASARGRIEASRQRVRHGIRASLSRTKRPNLSTIETIRDDFAFLEDWEDRYRYVIELGRSLEPLDEAARNELNRVRGCVSQVWIECEPRRNADGQSILHFRGDSDSHLVRGLVVIALALYSDRAPDEIGAVDAMSTFRELGLEQHLTPQRSNGVRAMIERIRSDALAFA
jgi:cysteine desulfuration protein SufE